MKIVLFANTDWYLFNFRRSLAQALRAAGHDVLLISPSGEFGPRLVELGFRWVPAPMWRRSLNPLRELLLVLWLARLFRREKVDLVHGFTIKCAVYGCLAAQLSGVKRAIGAVAGLGYVFTSQDARARILRPVVSSLLRLAFRGTGVRVILQNPDDVSQFVRARLVHASNVRLVRGSGVDCSSFLPVFDRAGDEFRVLLATRLLWDKGLAEYADACSIVLSSGRKISFLLAGTADSGNPAAVPEAAVRAWSDAGLLTWLGQVTDMPALLRSVDVAVLPSYREGLPKGLLEAAACGLPLITTDVPGCREVVDDGITGLLIPVRDARALASALCTLYDDPDLRLRLGTAARKKALTEFDERIVIHDTLAVYDELCHATSPDPRETQGVL